MRQRNLAVFEFEKGTQQEILTYIQHNLEFMRNRCLAFHFDVDSEFADFLHSLQIDFFKVCNENIFRTKTSKQALPEYISSDNQEETKIQKIPTKKIKITFDSASKDHVVMQTLENDEVSTHQINANLAEPEANNLNTGLLKVYDLTNAPNKKTPDEIIEHTNHNHKVICSKSLSSIVFKRAIRSGEELILDSHATFLKSINVGAAIKSYGNLQIYGKCDGILECFGDFIIIKEFSMGRISLRGIDLEGKMLEKVRKSQKLKMLIIENDQIEMLELS